MAPELEKNPRGQGPWEGRDKGCYKTEITQGPGAQQRKPDEEKKQDLEPNVGKKRGLCRSIRSPSSHHEKIALREMQQRSESAQKQEK